MLKRSNSLYKKYIWTSLPVCMDLDPDTVHHFYQVDPNPVSGSATRRKPVLLGYLCVLNFYSLTIKCRVVDPYSFFPDPDPEFDVGDQYGFTYP
jgi:hypothetical protein